MPEDSDKCIPLSFQVAFRRTATQKVEFGLAKSCKDVSGRIEAVWVIHFALLEKDGDEFIPKISVDININDEAPAKVKKAEETEKAGLSDRQTLFLLGPVCDSADEALEEPLEEELRALFASYDPARARVAAEPDPLEVLDRSGEEQEENVRRLKRRVVAVLDMQ